MTLNLLWSDDESSYAIVDSARSGPGSPRWETSVLGQRQISDRLRMRVEEGAHKLVRIGSAHAATMCGAESDAVQFARAVRLAGESGDFSAIFDFHNHDVTACRMSLSVLTGKPDAPVQIYRLPEKRIEALRPGGAVIEGSLPESLIATIHAGMDASLAGLAHETTTEVRLATGLAVTTTIAIQNNLTDHLVGGAFFGASVDKSGFRWQPDIAYLIFRPDSFLRCPAVLTGESPTHLLNLPKTAELFGIVQTSVRDDVAVASSSISQHGVICLPSWTDLDAQRWLDTWRSWLATLAISSAKYLALIPATGARAALVTNGGRYVRYEGSEISIRDDLASFLCEATEGTPFRVYDFTDRSQGLPEALHRTDLP